MERGERWKRRIESSRHGLWLIGLASYLESTVVPLPLEVVLLPYSVARRDRVWSIAAIVTAACLLGALTGYGLGYFAIDTLGRSVVEVMGWAEGLERFRDLFARHGFWAIVAIGVLPVPFQVAMLVAGGASYPLGLFVLASGLARSVRYFGLAALVVLAGERARAIWDAHAPAVALGAGAVCVLLLALSVWRA